jgi:hypothetical protein
MPPWGADPEHSLKMRNDRSLTQQQIDTIAAWVDGGAPKGSDADLPAVPKFAEGWTYGREPDYILEMPSSSRFPPKASSACRCSTRRCRSTRIGSPKCWRSGPATGPVVHHAGVFVVDIPEGARIDEHGRSDCANGKAATDRGEGLAGRADTTALPGANKLLSWVPGRGVDSHRPDVGKRIPAASTSTGSSTTTRSARRRPIARGSASGSTRCR